MRRTLPASAAALLLALVLPALPSAVAATPASTPAAPVPGGRSALGDSVMLGARDGLVSRGFAVDARESRQFSAAVPIVRARAADGSLRRNVVVHLGTNGYIQLSDCLAVVAAATRARRVFLVTDRVPRQWQFANNAVLKKCDAYFAPERVVRIDWYGYSAGHPSWVYSDGIHLTATGRRAYAVLLDATLDALAR